MISDEEAKRLKDKLRNNENKKTKKVDQPINMESLQDYLKCVHGFNFQDSYYALKNGSLDWKNVLSKLNHIQKIISETRSVEENDSDVEELKAFFGKIS